MQSFIHNGNVCHFVSQQLFYNGKLVGEFKGIKEAREYLVSEDMSVELAAMLPKTEKKAITESAIALALNESGEAKPTETLVHHIMTMVNEKRFFPSETLLSLRETYDDSAMTSKIEYVMRDGSTVLLDIETNRELNKIMDLKESAELLIYMTANSTNFMRCVGELLEDY